MKIQCAHCGRTMSMEAVVCGRTGSLYTETFGDEYNELLKDGHTPDSLAFEAGEFYDLCWVCDILHNHLRDHWMGRSREVEGLNEMWCEGL